MATDNLILSPNTSGTNLFIIQVIFLALAWLASGMRAFLKLVLIGEVTVDDYLMLLALLGYTASGYFVISAIVDGGLGRQSVELNAERIEIQLRSLYGNIAVSGLVSGLVRVAIALFLLRIALKTWHRFVLHGIIATTTATTLVFFFLAVFQCSPPWYFWHKTGDGSCALTREADTATIVWSSLAAAMDWMLGLLPVAILWHVRINWRSKVSIASVVGFAIIAGIALIVRLIYIKHNAVTHGDSVFKTLAISITAIVELALGIMAGCILTLPMLFKKIRFGSHKRKASSDIIPWQESFVILRPPSASVDGIMMQSPRRLQEAHDTLDQDTETRSSQPGSPSTKRVLSSSSWGCEIKVGDAKNDEAAPSPPPTKEIQVRTVIQVTSQPPDEYIIPVNAVDFKNKPLPMPPPPPKLKVRSMVKSRPHTPDLFI